MNAATKGALLSGFVYPGLGQIVQKHYGRGVALIGAVSASLVVIVATVVREVQAILDKALSGGVAPGLGALVAEANKASAGRGGTAMTVASVAILCCWVVGIVDAYVAGKRMESGLER
jgi:hypothetical protein